MTTSTAALSAWLLDQIAEDEAHANGWCEDRQACPQRDHPGHRCPAHVLAQVAAHRRIVELHEPGGGAWCTSACESESPTGCDTLRALAAIYADRPGFREEWAL